MSSHADIAHCMPSSAVSVLVLISPASPDTPGACAQGEEFMWSDTVKGTISSSFFIGYTLTNFVGERHGSKIMNDACLGPLKLSCCTPPD